MDEQSYLPPLDTSLALKLSLLDADRREWWSERAAIREFCGGQPRPEAEQGAWADLVKEFNLPA